MSRIISLLGWSFLFLFVFSPLALGADICSLVGKGVIGGALQVIRSAGN